MNNYVRAIHKDNGVVNTEDYTILAGAASDAPEDVCTKYPPCEAQVVKESCKKECCNEL